MKTLKIVLLIISIVTFSSCKKDTPADVKNDHLQKDSDGDFIPDYMDENRFMADIPLGELELKLLINGSKDSKLIEFTDNNQEINELKKMIINSKDSNVYTKRKFGLNKVTNILEIKPDNEILGITEEYQLPENINGLKVQYYQNEEEVFSTFNKGISNRFEVSGLKLNNTKVTYKVIDFNFSRMNKTFTLRDLKESVREKTYQLTIISSSQIKNYFVSEQINISKALESIPGGDDIRYNIGNWVSVNTGTQSLNYQPKKNDHVYLIEITSADQRQFYSNLETESHRIIDGSFKFNSDRTYDISIKLNGLMEYFFWGEHRKKVKSFVHMDFMCDIMEYWNTNHSKRINSRNMATYFDLYLNNELTTMPIIQNNEIKIIDIPFYTEIELRVKHKYMQPAKQGYHLRLRSSHRCNNDYIYPNGVKTAVKVRSLNSLTFIDYKLEITRSLAID